MQRLIKIFVVLAIVVLVVPPSPALAKQKTFWLREGNKMCKYRIENGEWKRTGRCVRLRN